MAIVLNGDGSITGAAGIGTGGSGQSVFFESSVTVDYDYTITTNYNAMSAGPITISNGITVTVPTGSEWTVV